MSVCPPARLPVCPSRFRVRSLSFQPLVGFKNYFAQMSSMMRRCAVPMFDHDRFKVKVTIKDYILYDCILCPLFIFWILSGFYKLFCTNVCYDETMCSAYVWPRLVQGQGLNLRLNIVWLYFMSALYLLNSWLDLQITVHKCQEWWDDVQCLCLTNVCLRSRSQFKI